MKNRIFCWIWSLVWKKYIDNGWRVIKVKGWRTALIDDSHGQRKTITPCFWIFQ